MNIILGAGLSGLICGALNAQARIFERNSSDFVSHRAVLRFRDDKIARGLGLTFRRVTVRKGIWFDGDRPPSPRLANLYSLKVRSVLAEASIWNLSTSERYIAPDNLHSILADICGRRVRWDHEVTADQLTDYRKNIIPVVSTIPLPILLSVLGLPAPFGLDHSPISVTRFNVPGCDVFQTVYFPSPDTPVYRATLTGPLLTVEAIGPGPLTEAQGDEVGHAFGLDDQTLLPQLLNHKQSYGKIAPVPDGPRKALLHHLTTQHLIYSLGRFATWRNILLDDVYDDIQTIRRMMAASSYDVNLERTKAS